MLKRDDISVYRSNPDVDYISTRMSSQNNNMSTIVRSTSDENATTCTCNDISYKRKCDDREGYGVFPDICCRCGLPHAFKIPNMSHDIRDDTMGSLCERLSSVDMDENVEHSINGAGGDNSHSGDPQSVEKGCVINPENIYKQDNDGDTLLHSAIILQEQALVLQLLTVTPSHVWLNIINYLHQTALHLAVLTRQTDIVRRLVIAGADVEARDKDGCTPLHLATQEGLMQIAMALLEPVRYIETKQNGYDIPYQRIPQNLEITNYDGLTCVHIAALNGHYDILKLLIEKGANINSKESKTGRTILHKACIEGNTGLVKYLLNCKTCDINARTYDNHTPFDLARACGHGEILMELAKAGARYETEEDSD